MRTKHKPLSQDELKRQMLLLSESVFETVEAVYGENWKYAELTRATGGVCYGTLRKLWEDPSPTQHIGSVMRVAAAVGLAVSFDKIEGFTLSVAKRRKAA